MTQPQAPNERFPFLTEADREAICIGYLKGLTPGFQKLEVFEQLARLGGLDTVEIVPFRVSPVDGKSPEVLLARRPDNDYFWPGLLHIAGSVIREDDPISHVHDFDPAINRAMSEMAGVRMTHGPVEHETVHRRGVRSREITIRFWAEVEGDSESGEFYDAADILYRAPELGIFDDHATYIERVLHVYESYRAGQGGTPAN